MTQQVHFSWNNSETSNLKVRRKILNYSTNHIPGCRGWQSESSTTKRCGCSTGMRGCVIEIVFKAPSLSSQSSSLHNMGNKIKGMPNNYKWRFFSRDVFCLRAEDSPVSFVRQRCILRVPPHTHLEDSQKEHGVHSKNTWRHCNSK